MPKSAAIFGPDNIEGFISHLDEPALLKGWGIKWKAYSNWSIEYFRQNFGDCVVPLSVYKDGGYQYSHDKKRVKLRDYLNFLSNDAPSTPEIHRESYLAGWAFLEDPQASKLSEDYEIPAPFANNILVELSKSIKYSYAFLFLGHDAVGSPLHTDSFFVAVWLAIVVGYKDVRFVRPNREKKNIRSGLDVFNKEVENELCAQGVEVVELHAEPGDIVYIPPGWWHQVKNRSFTIAISTNFVGSWNFLPFEQQFRSFVLNPYITLNNFKRKVLSDHDVIEETSLEVVRQSAFLENEERFLNYLSGHLRRDQEIVDLLKKPCDFD